MQVVLAVCLCLCWLCVSCRGCPGSPPGEGDLLLCRSCGHEVAFSSDLRFIASRLALAQRNHTGIGDRRVPVQLFENPQGFRFQVVTLKKAAVQKHWPADRHFSWFPGFSWTIATCPRCRAHLGWGFQPSEWPARVPERRFEEAADTFVALIVERLLLEDYAATLLLTPKAFKS
ncbi:CRBN protein, partial [Amia calva]|nr:CRBN protein [Amia calva]